MTTSPPLLAKTWKKALIGIGPLFVLALFLGDLVRGHYIASRDTTSFLYVIRRWFSDRFFSQGTLPHWLEGLFSGMNIHTDPQLGIFSPFMWLYFVFDGYLAHQIYTLLILALGSVGMGLYMQKLIGHRLLAVFLGALYVACGLVISGVHNTVYLTGVCLFPWVLWRYECLRTQPCVSNSLWLSLSIAWVVMEGDVFFCFWCSSYLFFDSALRCLYAKRFEALFLFVLLAGAVAILITSIVWLPPFETMDSTRRAIELPFEQTSYFSTHPMRLLNLLAPSLWGGNNDGTFWGHAYLHPRLPFSPRFWHDAIYMSIPLLCLFFWAIYQSFRQKQHRLIVVLALLFVFISLGDNFVLHKILYDYFPFYSKLRFPAKFFAYAFLFIFVLAAWGLWHLLQKMRAGNWNTLNRFLAIMACTYFLASVLCIAFSGNVESSEKIANLNLQMAQDKLTTNAVLSFLFGLVCLGGFFAGRIGSSKYEDVAKIQFSGICILILVELVLWLPPIRTEPASVFDDVQRLEKILSTDGTGGPIKILRDANIDRFWGQKRSHAGRESLLHNWAILSGKSYVFGYQPAVPARFDKLSGPNVFRRLDIWLETLGITHILSSLHPSSTQLRHLTEQGVMQIVEILKEENIIVLRPMKSPAFTRMAARIRWVDDSREAFVEMHNRNSANDAAIVEKDAYLLEGRIRFDPEPIQKIEASFAEKRDVDTGRVVKLVRTANRIEIELDSDQSVLLIVKEGFSPGWQAFGDGQALPILCVDFINMGVWVNQSTSKVTFEFHPRMFWVATVPTLTGLFLIFSFLFVQTMIRMRKKQPVPKTEDP